MKFTSSLAVVMSLGILASCAEKNSTHLKKTIAVGSILSSSASPNDKAEKLALAAEQLLTPSGFIYADMILDQALELDPANKRAGLYKAFLAAPMASKGILARIKPLADKDPKAKKQLADTIANLKEGNYKNFLLDGKGDITNEAGVQAFADSVINGLGKLREFAKANKNLEITLNVNDYFTKPAEYEYHSSYCSTYPTSNGDYTTECNEYSDVYHNSTPAQFSMNRGDFESVQHITAGYQIYGALLNSYSASGAINVAKNAQGKSTSQIFKELSKDAEFGKLRNNIFSQIPELGADAILGIRWAMDIQSELCPAGQAQSGSRPGMLVASGVCIKGAKDEIEKTLQLAELALSGNKMSIKTDIGETEILPKAILDNPIKDLKAVKPVFNKCGKVVSVSDETLNGAFPNGDLNELLANSSDCPDAI
jgi:hypothetical protein